MTIVSNKSAEFSSKEVRPDQKLCIPVVISLQQLEKKVECWDRCLVSTFWLAEIKKITSYKVKFVPVSGQVQLWGSRLDRLFSSEELMTLYSVSGT